MVSGNSMIPTHTGKITTFFSRWPLKLSCSDVPSHDPCHPRLYRRLGGNRRSTVRSTLCCGHKCRRNPLSYQSAKIA